MKIYSNKIRCKHCGDIIESKHVHDFKYCSCGKCAVDGGLDYLRRVYDGSTPEEVYEELSEYEEQSETHKESSEYEEYDEIYKIQGRWIEPKEKYATPGGDPVWVCSVCGGDIHVCGIETAYNEHHVCNNCGSHNKYPYEYAWRKNG